MTHSGMSIRYRIAFMVGGERVSRKLKACATGDFDSDSMQIAREIGDSEFIKGIISKIDFSKAVDGYLELMASSEGEDVEKEEEE